MPFASKIRDLMALVGAISRSGLRDAIEGESPHTFQPGEDPTQFTPGLCRVIIVNGIVFNRDDADATTPHDGIVCVVCQGIRFKTSTIGQGVTARIFPVKSINVAPPGSPTLGFAYLVGIAGTGAFATHDNQIAIWTTAGWQFAVPKTFDRCYVEATNLGYYFSSGGAWVQGDPVVTLADSSILFTKLKHGLGLSIENQTTNAPPPSPANGVAYIIGGSPTGAWAGQALKLTIFDGSAWVFFTPAIGWTVYDKASSLPFVYSATGWATSAPSAYTQRKQFRSAVALVYNVLNGSYLYSSTPPTIAESTNIIWEIAHQAKSANAWIELQVTFPYATLSQIAGAVSELNLAVFIDGATNASQWVQMVKTTNASPTLTKFSTSVVFLIQAPDTLSHIYRLRFSHIITPLGNGGTITIDFASVILREAA